MVIKETIRLFAGEAPSNAISPMLAQNESCFARFAHDPEARLWVCARVGDQVFATALGAGDEWLRPGSGELMAAEAGTRSTRRLAPRLARAA